MKKRFKKRICYSIIWSPEDSGYYAEMFRTDGSDFQPSHTRIFERAGETAAEARRIIWAAGHSSQYVGLDCPEFERLRTDWGDES